MKKAGISALSVGIGAKINWDELGDLASSPSNVFHVSNFNALGAILKSVENRTCEGELYVTDCVCKWCIFAFESMYPMF